MTQIWKRGWRIGVLTAQGFSRSQIQQGASSLTYYTLLALVPVLALLVGIARGFLLEKTLKEWLLTRFAEQGVVVEKIFEFAEASLREAKGGLIAGLGIVLLFWAAIKILLCIELVLNDIWEVKHPRSLARQFSDYLALILICPLMVVGASATTVYLSTDVAVFKGILHLLPFVLTGLLFTFLYIFMPNTRVRFLPALYAGLVAALFYQVLQWVYLGFQIGVAKYNAIYGTFAALPLFLIWVHLSWTVILLGAKMAFAFQNVEAYEFIKEQFALSWKFKKLLALRIAALVIKTFCEEKPPLSAIELSNRLSTPLILTNQLLFELTEGGVVSEIKRDEDQEDGFQPARSVDHLTIMRVLDMLEERGETLDLPPSPELDSLLASLESFRQEVDRSDANRLLKDL